VVVYVAGEIDLATAPTLQTCLTAQLECSTQHPVLVVDLAAVDFISCAGLRVLLEAQQHAAVHGTAFRLAGCSRVVLRLLNLADLHGEFDSYPTVRDALGWSARRQA
jgi:anti-anti-sigma factor